MCDQFDAQVLMPVGDGDRHDVSLHLADGMAGLFARSEASRSATLQRVREVLSAESRCHLCGTAPERPTTCTSCFMAYTPAEMASGDHDCF